MKRYSWYKNLVFFCLVLFVVATLFAPISLTVQDRIQITSSEVFAQLGQTEDPLAVIKDQDGGLLSHKKLGTALVSVGYWIILTPVIWLTSIAAGIFDTFVEFSINSRAYNNANDFIIQGWALVRDITNILFIIGLLYIAGATIFSAYTGASTSQTKKFLVTLIIAAIFVNFSLFIGRVIVDISNLAARSFYNNIETPELVVATDDNAVVGSQIKPISQLLLNKFAPQILLQNPNIADPNGNFWENVAKMFIAMSLLVFIHIVLLATFLSVGLLFIGRLVALWILMIISPAAVAIMALPPKVRSVFGSNDFSFQSWLSETMKQGLMAPVFLFFLYLIILFVDLTGVGNSGSSLASQGNAGSGDLFTEILLIVIPFIVIITLLRVAKKQAESMSSKFAKSTVEGIQKVAGAAFGVTALAVGGVGRVAGGAISKGVATVGSKQVASGVARGGRGGAIQKSFGRVLRSAGERGQASSWDVRNLTQSKALGGLVGGVARRTQSAARADFGDFQGALGRGSSSSYTSMQKDIKDRIGKTADKDAADVQKYSAKKQQSAINSMKGSLQKEQDRALREGKDVFGNPIGPEYERTLIALNQSKENFKKAKSSYGKGDPEYDKAHQDLLQKYQDHKSIKDSIGSQQVTININGQDFTGSLNDAKKQAGTEITKLQAEVNIETKQNLETLADQIKNLSTLENLMYKGGLAGAVVTAGAAATTIPGAIGLGALGYAAGSGLGYLTGKGVGKRKFSAFGNSVTLGGGIDDLSLYSDARKEVAKGIMDKAKKIGEKEKSGPKPENQSGSNQQNP